MNIIKYFNRMKNQNKKNLQKEYANKAIQKYFSFLDVKFYPPYNEVYIKEILKISKSFNIRLKKEEKLKFCKKCFSYLNFDNKKIRVNKNTKCVEHICKNCGNIKRIRYKK